ncbi:hypothetical protein EC178200_4270 [Escherichia coli 178200]|nr:hypothetical protein EC180600_4703 [Escherichia coli 180600]EMW94288.1 hypothetical protein ECP03047771_5061 [Escherichia coli P0304777.1]ENE56170.1 hypothetical protein ECP030477710_4846 [Escherichia coli P0304777.10]ENE58163.1 hypothetical protein ECP030477713_5100 [Escherichia coli P0304777.13]ENE59852.1 hypothetical protein ECP030477712_4686 [Escherichia coli P0304777.12]ENE74984.1 hypothetical protein ECP03047772_4653 [Escherichia coli P0304777.2]ENE83015.1 hypothetical protein ECP030
MRPFLPVSALAVCTARNVVNATMFDRYGDADDFLDSQEIKHVY